MITTILLVASINLSSLSYKEIETYYWDCDTLYMQKSLGGQDLNNCLAITNYFMEKYFVDTTNFLIYWEQNRLKEYYKRGYKINNLT